MRFKKGGVMMGAALATIVAGSAAADTIVQSQDFSFPLSPNSAILSFDQFDSSLGELKSVEILIDGEIGAAVTAENDSILPSPDFSLNISGFMTVDFSTLSGLILFDETIASGGVGPTDGVPGSGPDFFDFGQVGDSGNDGDFEDTDLASYIGGGTIDANVAAAGGFAVFGSTDATINISDFDASGTITVIYDYNPIPAPGAVALLGLAAVAGRRRRRA